MPLPTSVYLTNEGPVANIDPLLFNTRLSYKWAPVPSSVSGTSRVYYVKPGQDAPVEFWKMDAGSNIVAYSVGSTYAGGFLTLPCGVVIQDGFEDEPTAMKKTTEYDFQLRFELGAAFSPTSNHSALKFNSSADTNRPVITYQSGGSYVVGTPTSSGVTIAWHTSEANCTNTVEYWTGNGFHTIVSASAGQDPIKTITGISPGTWQFKVHSLDAAGNDGANNPGSTALASGQFSIVAAAGGALSWVRQISMTLYQAVYPIGVAIKSSGNIVVAGYFAGRLDCGGGWIFNSRGVGTQLDLFLAEYSAAGVIQWARQIGGTDPDLQFGNITVDSSDNIIFAGGFRATVNFGDLPGDASGTLISAGGAPGVNNIFVCKYGPGSFGTPGSLIWAKGMGGTGNDISVNVAVDSSGNPFVLLKIQSADGEYGPDISDASVPLARIGNASAAIAKLRAADGKTYWAKRYGEATGSMLDSAFGGIAVDSAGDVVIAGNFRTKTNLGGSDITVVGTTDAFVAKYSGSTGAYVWGHRIGHNTNPSNENALSVAIHSSTKNIVVSGGFSGGITNLGGADIDIGGAGFWIAAYNTDTGAFLWDKHSGGTVGDSIKAVAIDTSGHLVITGSTRGGLDWGPGIPSQSSYSSYNYFVVGWVWNGSPTPPTWSWQKLAGNAYGGQPLSTATDFGAAVAVRGGFVATAGAIDQGNNDRAYLDNTTYIMSPYAWSTFVAKYTV